MSTGYPVRHQFVMKAPTSSGQALVATSGVNLTIGDGASIHFSSGSAERSTDIQAISASTGGTIRRSGYTMISMTSDVVTGVFTLAAPVAGIRKRIWITGSSSNVVRILGASSDVYFNLTDRHSIATISSGAMHTQGYGLDLWSSGTASWRVLRIDGASSNCFMSTGIA